MEEWTPREIRNFLTKIQRNEQGCWIWTGCLDTGGYAHKGFRGRTHKAHRLAYEWIVAKVPDGMELDHLCRNRSCVNPAHLEPVPHQVNCQRGQVGKHGNYLKGPASPEWKGGRPFCISCGQRTQMYKAKRCRKCWQTSRKSEIKRGAASPLWKGGKPSCQDCGKLLSHYASKRCPECSHRSRKKTG